MFISPEMLLTRDNLFLPDLTRDKCLPSACDMYVTESNYGTPPGHSPPDRRGDVIHQQLRDYSTCYVLNIHVEVVSTHAVTSEGTVH